VLGLVLGASLAPRHAAANEELEFFEKQVRPLLIERCHKCHAGEQEKGGLRLDSREAVLSGGDSGPAIVPGQAAESLLVAAISYDPDSYQMPPTGKLPDGEIAILTEWVARGAPWTPPTGPADAPPAAGKSESSDEVLARAASHWSFQPIKEVALHEVRDPDWCRGAIDRFVLAGLEAVSLAPAAEADRHALLRRVTYDLTGLPPTRAEIDAFVGDTSPAALERVVDRLLASPHYGERWGRHWLDLVRYSETAGHEFDYDLPDAYRYRDYVVRALNQDLPFDQFVVEQIAGDLVHPPRRHPTEGTNESILGTGFYWLGESIHSPVDVTEEQAKRVDNQIDVLAKTFLGLTVSCARCHDHKFDPITARDYYALAGIIKSTRYEHASIELPQSVAAGHARLFEFAEKLQQELLGSLRTRWQAELDTLAADLNGLAADPTQAAGNDPQLTLLRERLAAAQTQPEHPLYPLAQLLLVPLTPEAFVARRDELVAQAASGPGDLLNDFDDPKQPAPQQAVSLQGAWTPSGLAFGGGTSQTLRVSPTDDGKLRLTPSGIASSLFPAKELQGALRSPDFILSQPKLAYRLRGQGVRVRLILDGFHRIQEPIYGVLQFEVNSPAAWTWHVQDVSMWTGRRGYLEVLDEGPGWIEIDEIRACDAPPAPQMHPLLRELLAQPGLDSPQGLAAAYAELLARVVSASDPQTTDFVERLVTAGCLSAEWPVDLPAPSPELSAEQQRLVAQLAAPRTAMAAAEGTPTDDRLQIRGNHKQLGPVVPRRALEVLLGKDQPSPSSGTGRWELAQHLIDPAHPLVSRVLVNRIWQHHFGTGLVASPDDFGRMGQAPTHPELLDFLARDFVQHGWSLKRLHRQILLSSAYRQSSRASAEAAQVDPQNRLLSHFPPQRLEAEAIRDALLVVSGRLDRTLYGPSIAPHLTPFMQGRGRPQSSGPLDGNGRRSIYLNVRRNFLNPLFLAFDYPQPFSTMGRRTTSNVPAQALALLNNPLVWEQAKLWAERVVSESTSDEDRVRGMYLDALTRLPEPAELTAALAFLSESRQPTKPAVAANEATSGPDGTAAASSADLDAWTELAHALFNLKEFVYVR